MVKKRLIRLHFDYNNSIDYYPNYVWDDYFKQQVYVLSNYYYNQQEVRLVYDKVIIA
jgi:hypothetical protein